MHLWNTILNTLPFDWAHYPFMQNALLAVLIAAPLFALLGCMVIQNQMSFFSEAMGHSAYTGIAIGALFGMAADPALFMLLFALALAAGIVAVRRYSTLSNDTVIALVMSLVVALGVVLLSRNGGFAKYSRFLVGDLLNIAPAEILRLLVLAAVVVAAWLVLFNRLFMTSLNRPLARSRGVSVLPVEMIFSMLVAAVVTVTIPWIGLLVINSMLIVPAATARNLARTTAGYVRLAVLLSVLAGVLGCIASYYWSTATGATIVLVACGFFALSLPFRRR